jgi:S1-C subfamily serine protease
MIDNVQSDLPVAVSRTVPMMIQTLAAFSTSISQLVMSATPLVSAIRVGPNRHITGLVCPGDAILTTDQGLPALDSYTVVLSNRLLIGARPGRRDPRSNLAVLHLDMPWPAVGLEIASPAVGMLVVVLGADADASPTVRLTVIHRFIRTADGPAPVLDLPGDRIDEGGPVLDPNGRLVGLAALGPNGEAVAVPCEVISRMLTLNHAMPTPLAPPIAAPASSIPAPASPGAPRRGWLGVALQPITVPEPLVARAGQGSGRMVVSITRGGPAEMAGMRVGDVLLALDGTSASGPHAMRAFLGGDRVGTTVEVRLLRDGNVVTTCVTVAIPPG